MCPMALWAHGTLAKNGARPGNAVSCSTHSEGVSSMARHDPSFPRVSRLALTVLLAIPLALLALAPTAGRAAAHPAAPVAPHAAVTGQIGRSSGPAMDLTLHIHTLVSVGGTPYRMGTD